MSRIKTRYGAVICRLEARMSLAETLSGANRNALAESTFLTAALMWEGYVHELFVAYINNDSEQLSKWLLNAITQSTNEKRGAVVGKHVQLALPKHLTRADIEQVLDPEGQNVSFKSADAMINRAAEWLPIAAATRFQALSGTERDLINAWKSIRNYLAHRSASAERVMNQVLASTANPTFRRGGHLVADVGSYLDSKASNGNWRIKLMLTSMKEIAGKL